MKVHKAMQKKEKTPTLVFRTAADANLYVATQIKELILATTNRPVVLGLATGSTPVGTELTIFLCLKYFISSLSVEEPPLFIPRIVRKCAPFIVN